MTKIISLVNQKGGVGKTTTSINLAASLGKLGKKTLLIDLDPQGNTTTGLGVNKGDIKNSIYEVLNGSSDCKRAIIKTKFKNLSIIPATINLAGLDVELLEKGYQDLEFKKNEQLRNALSLVKDNYEYIIIDCPPSLGLLTTNALVASDSVIIPVQCEFFALEGITQLLNTIIMTQTRLNPNLKIEGVLLTLLDSRTNLGLEVVEEVRKFFKEKVFNTIIPRLIRLVEAPSHGEPINEYDPSSRAAEAYLNLAREVIERNGN
ncbi:MAG TPA: ParA family protein [Mollicutes bacterium]|nr:ParA family protein [Mollicutes bacterium]